MLLKTTKTKYNCSIAGTHLNQVKPEFVYNFSEKTKQNQKY